MTRLMDRFDKFHTENPQVYELFKKISYQAKERGFKNIGGRFVLEIMRWESSVQTVGDIFKLNNDYIAIYTRMLMDTDKEFEGFFRTRMMTRA